MLKKQTVWLLTMLSLMIVLSVYYLTSPDDGDLAFVNQGQDNSEETATEDVAGTEDEANVDGMTNVGQDEYFTTMRMEVQDKRSKEIDRLDDIVASNTASTEEKNKAYDDIAAIEDRSTKEAIIEESVLAAADYKDVLVRYNDGKVHVHVKVDEKLTNTEVVNIMQMVRDEFGEITVNVNWQPTEG